MGLQCNINRRGRIARLVWGVVLLTIGGAILFAWALPSGSVLAWAAVVVCVIGGAFSLFEAWAGWCGVRAMGFRTPM